MRSAEYDCIELVPSSPLITTGRISKMLTRREARSRGNHEHR